MMPFSHHYLKVCKKLQERLWHLYELWQNYIMRDDIYGNDDEDIEDITSLNGDVTFVSEPNSVPYWQWDLSEYNSYDAFRFYATLDNREVYKIEYLYKDKREKYIIPVTDKKWFELLEDVWYEQLKWMAIEDLEAYIAEM